MGDRKAKDDLFDGFAEVAKALSSGRRAELIDVLEQGDRNVEQLADIAVSAALRLDRSAASCRGWRCFLFPLIARPAIPPRRVFKPPARWPRDDRARLG